MRRVRIVALVLLGVTACRDDGRGTGPLTPAPGASVEQQFDDMESTLDSIESELNGD